MLRRIFQSGTCAALLFLSTLAAMAAPAVPEAARFPESSTFLLKAEALALARHPVWTSLLHLQGGDPQIPDRNFLLSWEKFSPEAELKATLELLATQGQAAVCKFPARALWLQSQLGLPQMDTGQCPEIAEFIVKAPFDKLELVFADESVTQPASILGHGFLRISGERSAHVLDHAVSFYTHAETINLPKLLWDSLVSGKEGLFSLVPYEQEERKYLEDDQRNLWRYEIRTTAFERELIRNHLFELKNSQLTYYFHRYNCATLLRNLLALGGDLPPATRWWSTPKDVVKDLHVANRVLNTEIQLADAWLVTQLASDVTDANKVRQRFLGSSTSAEWSGMSWSPEQSMALQAYNRWLLHKGKISQDAYGVNLSVIEAAVDSAASNVALKVDPALNPVFSEGESNWRAEWRRTGSVEKILVRLTPASHDLMQPRGQASAETELLLLSPTISVDGQQRVRLEEFQLFSMRSWIPWDPLLRPWSTQTSIGFGSVTGHPADRRDIHASLQLGLTTRKGAFDLFAVTGPGLRSSSQNSWPAYVRTDLGALWRHGDAAKSRLTWTSWDDFAKRARRVEVEQSWFLAPNWIGGWRGSETQQFSTRVLGFSVYLLHSF